jgi:hypothetical protein
MAVFIAHRASVDWAEASISFSLSSSIDSKTGLASFSSLLIQPLLQEAQSHFTCNFGFAVGQLPSVRPPRSASMRAVLEIGKRFISHTGQASSLVDTFSLQNMHLRILLPTNYAVGMAV